MMDIPTSTSAESQIDYYLTTPQLIQTDKPLQIITSKDFSTNETFVHVVIQSLKDHINSLENQLKDKNKIIDGLSNLNSGQRSCNSASRNHQEQKLADNIMGLPTSTNYIINADISTNYNPKQQNFNLNRRDKLLKMTTPIKRNKFSISDLAAVYHQKVLHRS